MTPSAYRLEQVTRAYRQADALDGLKYPYEFGGGHPSPHRPWQKVDGSGIIVPAAGPDCSGWVSNILAAGNLLGGPQSLNSEGFESWGLEGRGELITVWVLDIPGEIHHVFVQFTVPGLPHHWSAARHTGTICGWQDAWSASVTDGYHARRPAA